MVQSVESSDGEDGVPKFPGPLTLFPSQERSKRSLAVLGTFTIIGIVMSFKAAPFGIFVAAVSGFGLLGCVIRQLPGAGSLRLYEHGFEAASHFRKQQYRWSEVIDFGTWTFFFNSMVVFKAAKSHLGILGKINATLAGERNGHLPDTYRMAANDLAQLMTSWRNSAMNAAKESAKLNGLDPESYLADVIDRMANRHPINRLSELLPGTGADGLSNWRRKRHATLATIRIAH
jgi:hypothetical protein